MRIRLLLLLILSFAVVSFLKAQDTSARKANYDTAFLIIKKLVKDDDHKGFKKAVFITEYAYTDGVLDYRKFDNYIYHLTFLCRQWIAANPLQNYGYQDSTNFLANYAIYKLMKDTMWAQVRDRLEIVNLPCTYNFEDFSGHLDWSNMFVSRLMVTHKGNCHSLPYLYKILADELEARCWLGLAPNHIYIKNRCREMGWYNTELTSGYFPIDAWITASGYIPLKAIQSGIYMDTLSNQQAIALCALDLAKGFEFQTKDYYDGFILKCCDLVLQYHPVNVQALLLKAETLKRVYEKQEREKDISAQQTYNEMEQLYVKLFDLGYREMPEKMYQDWLVSLVKEKDKYLNKNLNPVGKKINASTRKK